eukprot:g16205.t1
MMVYRPLGDAAVAEGDAAVAEGGRGGSGARGGRSGSASVPPAHPDESDELQQLRQQVAEMKGMIDDMVGVNGQLQVEIGDLLKNRSGGSVMDETDDVEPEIVGPTGGGDADAAAGTTTAARHGGHHEHKLDMIIDIVGIDIREFVSPGDDRFATDRMPTEHLEIFIDAVANIVSKGVTSSDSKAHISTLERGMRSELGMLRRHWIECRNQWIHAHDPNRNGGNRNSGGNRGRSDGSFSVNNGGSDRSGGSSRFASNGGRSSNGGSSSGGGGGGSSQSGSGNGSGGGGRGGSGSGSGGGGSSRN